MSNLRLCTLCGRDVDLGEPGMKIIHTEKSGKRINVLDSRGIAHITKKLKPKLEVAAKSAEE